MKPMSWLVRKTAIAELSKTTMKLNCSLHRRFNVEIIVITVLHKNMKARKSIKLHQVM